MNGDGPFRLLSPFISGCFLGRSLQRFTRSQSSDSAPDIYRSLSELNARMQQTIAVIHSRITTFVSASPPSSMW